MVLYILLYSHNKLREGDQVGYPGWSPLWLLLNNHGFQMITPATYHSHIDGLVQERRNSSALYKLRILGHWTRYVLHDYMGVF